MKPVRVLIVDDHQIVREGLRTVLAQEKEVEVVGEAPDGERAIAQARQLAPDVVLMDLVMPGMGGLEALARIREACPGSQVVVLTESQAEYESIWQAQGWTTVLAREAWEVTVHEKLKTAGAPR